MKLIDIRDAFEYRASHIPNSINIEEDLLILAPEKYLIKNNKYCLYCNKGIKSEEVCNALNRKGYNTCSLKGGFEKWQKENNMN